MLQLEQPEDSPRHTYCSHLFQQLQGREEPDFSATLLSYLLRGGMPLHWPFISHCCRALGVPRPSGKAVAVDLATARQRQITPGMAPLQIGWDGLQLAVLPIVAEPLVSMPWQGTQEGPAEKNRQVVICPEWRADTLTDEARPLGIDPVVVTWEALWEMLPDQWFWLVPELYEHVARRSKQHSHLGAIPIPGFLNIGMLDHGTWEQWQLLQWLRPCFPWPGPITSEAEHWVGFDYGRESTGWLRFVRLEIAQDKERPVELVLHTWEWLELDPEYFSPLSADALAAGSHPDGHFWTVRCDMDWHEIRDWKWLFEKLIKSAA